MVWKLGELCLKSIQNNIESYPSLCQKLPNKFKEILIQRLALHEKISKSSLPQISQALFASTLRNLKLRNASVTDEMMQLLKNTGCKLEILELNDLGASLTDVGMQAILEGQDQLHFLYMKKLSMVTKKSIKFLKSPKLEHLKMKQLYVGDGLNDSDWTSILEKNPNIKWLTVNGLSYLNVITKSLKSLEELDMNFQDIKDDGIEMLAQNCLNLKKLDLNGAKSVGKEALINLFQSCTQLDELDLSYCTNLTISKQREVFWTLPQSLTRLSLVGLNIEIDDLFVECLIRLPFIRKLKLCGVTALKDKTLKQVLEVIGSQLTELNISGIDAGKLTDEGLKSITEYCTNLESLHMSLLQAVSGVTLLPLFNNPSRAGRITTLAMNSRKMEASVLDVVIASCPNLQFLDVAGLSFVTDDMIMTLADHAPKLSYVGLKGCTQLTDKSLCYLVSHCRIDSLVLSGVISLTDKTIFHIVSSRPEIKELYLNGCSKVTFQAIKYLKDECMHHLDFSHSIPKVNREHLMGRNLDTGDFIRIDGIRSHAVPVS